MCLQKYLLYKKLQEKHTLFIVAPNKNLGDNFNFILIFLSIYPQTRIPTLTDGHYIQTKNIHNLYLML